MQINKIVVKLCIILQVTIANILFRISNELNAIFQGYLRLVSYSSNINKLELYWGWHDTWKLLDKWLSLSSRNPPPPQGLVLYVNWWCCTFEVDDQKKHCTHTYWMHIKRNQYMTEIYVCLYLCSTFSMLVRIYGKWCIPSLSHPVFLFIANVMWIEWIQKIQVECSFTCNSSCWKWYWYHMHLASPRKSYTGVS